MVGPQAGRLVQDMDLVPCGPVDLVAGQDPAAEPGIGQSAATVGPGVNKLTGFHVEEEHAIAGCDQPSLGYPQKVGQTELVRDRVGLPDEAAGRRLEGIDAIGVVRSSDHESVVNDGGIEVAVVSFAPGPVLPNIGGNPPDTPGLGIEPPLPRGWSGSRRSCRRGSRARGRSRKAQRPSPCRSRPCPCCYWHPTKPPGSGPTAWRRFGIKTNNIG